MNPNYKPAVMRSIGTPLDAFGFVGLAISPLDDRSPDAAFRFRLTVDEAERMAIELLRAAHIQTYRSDVQLFKSSGTPSVDGSTPPGHSQ